jgi:aryl-alcohol dehydrogenase-like predicted oxidoreductase
MGPGANDGGLSAYHVRAAAEASLRRLKTDRVDLYQMHHVDRGLPHPKSALEFLGGDIRNLYFPPQRTKGTPWEEIWQAMEVLVTAGKVVYVGSSNFAAWNIAQANERASARGFLGLVSEQSKYNLMARTVELEMIPVCRDYGLGLIPYSPLAGGALAGGGMQGSGGRRSNLSLPAEDQQRLQEYESLCRSLGEEPANVGLAWLLHNPVVTAPIVGPRTVAQLESAVRAIDIELSAETLKRLDEIFPGPGNQAPEAYAW